MKKVICVILAGVFIFLLPALLPFIFAGLAILMIVFGIGVGNSIIRSSNLTKSTKLLSRYDTAILHDSGFTSPWATDKTANVQGQIRDINIQVDEKQVFNILKEAVVK